MNIDKKLSKKSQVIDCKNCNLKNHYRYTREELIEIGQNSKTIIKPCISDFCMSVVWLNYKLED